MSKLCHLSIPDLADMLDHEYSNWAYDIEHATGIPLDEMDEGVLRSYMLTLLKGVRSAK